MEGTAEKTNMAVPETADTVAEADAGNGGHCGGSRCRKRQTLQWKLIADGGHCG